MAKKGRGNIEGLAKHLSHKLGGDPHFFTKCMADEQLAGYDEDARSGICAKAHKLAIGIYPGEHGGKNPMGMKEVKAKLTFILHTKLPEPPKGTIVVTKGGKGSGNFGHAGRPGKLGGSAPMGGMGASPEENARKREHAAQNRTFVDKLTGGGAKTMYDKYSHMRKVGDTIESASGDLYEVVSIPKNSRDKNIGVKLVGNTYSGSDKIAATSSIPKIVDKTDENGNSVRWFESTPSGWKNVEFMGENAISTTFTLPRSKNHNRLEATIQAIHEPGKPKNNFGFPQKARTRYHASIDIRNTSNERVGRTKGGFVPDPTSFLEMIDDIRNGRQSAGNVTIG